MLDLGYTKLEPKGGSGGSSGPLFRGGLDWRLSQRSEFSVDASYQFADAAQDLIVQVGNPPDPVLGVPGDPDLQIVPDTFRERRLTLGYRYAGERLNLQIEPYYSRLNYVDGVALDQENRGATFDASFRLRAQLSLSFVAGWREREFEGGRARRRGPHSGHRPGQPVRPPLERTRGRAVPQARQLHCRPELHRKRGGDFVRLPPLSRRPMPGATPLQHAVRSPPSR